MRKIAIVTDTASDVSQDLAQKYNIKMLHYQIVYKEKTFKDQLEITSKEVLESMVNEVPTTSLPSLEEMHSLFTQIKEEGYTDVIVVTLSSGLSGCYNAVCMMREEYPELSIHVYDSKTISAAEGVLAIRAAELAGSGYEPEAIIKELDIMRSKQETLFIVDTLEYLLLGGRIGHVSATLGKILNLKPLITVGDDGKYETVAKVRGRAKAISHFVNAVKEKTNTDKSYKIYFVHGDGEDTRDKIREGIEKEISEIKEINNIESIEDWGWISPVACVHCGPAFVAMLIQEV